MIIFSYASFWISFWRKNVLFGTQTASAKKGCRLSPKWQRPNGGVETAAPKRPGPQVLNCQFRAFICRESCLDGEIRPRVSARSSSVLKGWEVFLHVHSIESVSMHTQYFIILPIRNIPKGQRRTAAHLPPFPFLRNRPPDAWGSEPKIVCARRGTRPSCSACSR